MTASYDAAKTKIGDGGATSLKKPPASSSDISPKRFGLKFNPPQIVLEYVEVSSGKLFHRVMGLSKLKKDTDPMKVAVKLREKNQPYLSHEKVTLDQIVNLVKKLQTHLGAPAATAA